VEGQALALATGSPTATHAFPSWLCSPVAWSPSPGASGRIPSAALLTASVLPWRVTMAPSSATMLCPATSRCRCSARPRLPAATACSLVKGWRRRLRFLVRFFLLAHSWIHAAATRGDGSSQHEASGPARRPSPRILSKFPARIRRRGRGQARRRPPPSGDVCDLPLADWRSFMDAAGRRGGDSGGEARWGGAAGLRRRIEVGRARKRRRVMHERPTDAE
jgi:hypothetical protein